MKRVKNTVDGNDTINKLHDDQLRHIINLLPTKDALRTSILSSRWKNLWLCISNIDLDDFRLKSRHSNVSFRKSIDRLLVHHDSSYIKRFCFSSDGAFVDRTRTRSWISEVIKHNVEELRIGSSLGSYRSFKLPLCLFKSESLTVLEIDNKSIILGSNDSSLFSVHLPSLKRLKLSRVGFLSNRSTHFFSNIPKLQYLCLWRCDWKKVNRLIIDIPTLEGIDVAIRDTYMFKCQVTINAPNLTSFKCDTDFSIEFLVSNHSSSLDVYLKTYFLGKRDRLVLPILLESVKEAMSLHVEWNFRTYRLLQHNRIETEDLPLFMNLKQLKISTDHYSTCHDVEFKKILMFLHSMPNLVSFTISVTDTDKQGGETFGQHFEYVWSKDGVPSCVINQIKEFSIITSKSCTYLSAKRDYYYSTVMGLIKYFLNHSRSLETLEINWLCYLSSPTGVVLDEIKRHPRYSELKRFSCHTYDIPEP